MVATGARILAPEGLQIADFFDPYGHIGQIKVKLWDFRQPSNIPNLRRLIVSASQIGIGRLHEGSVNATSPASSGPAGPHFEGQVGAHYLLTLLVRAEPRGLPGTTIDRVRLQGASEGLPLDDVIIFAHDSLGREAVLEIQVKRSITFAPGDPVFWKVVGQIVEAYQKSDFWNSRHELAVAIARTSRKIDGAYQDVLQWARQLGSASVFFSRIARAGSANEDMRTFAQTFREHVRDAGGAHDDETIWKLLQRLQILVFDFTAPGSASEELAKERAARVLHPDDVSQAGPFWSALVERSIKIASSGGERTRDVLIEDLRQNNVWLAGDRWNSAARGAIAEAANAVLDEIGDRVGDMRLTRHERVQEVRGALEIGRYVEIRGDAGVGKSGLLKHLAQQLRTEGRVMVFSPGCTQKRGWLLRSVLGFYGTARELLSDLASDGGATLFIDNLDTFDVEEQRTVVDLVREAANVPGLSVIATARRNFEVEEPSWLPAEALDRLGRAPPVVIEELTANEVGELRQAAPNLAPLLADTHPARDVVRNLYRLARLVSRTSDDPAPRTEVEMAEQWWRTADGRIDAGHRERARVLRAAAEQGSCGGFCD